MIASAGRIDTRAFLSEIRSEASAREVSRGHVTMFGDPLP